MTRKELCFLLDEKISSCEKCELHTNRIKAVPGEGNLNAKLMIVGEAPGKNENESGRPFVGQAGELLTNMLEACGLSRDQVFIANAVCCRPPANRTPLHQEVTACSSYLDLRIKLMKPKLIIALGNTALRRFLPDHNSVTTARGKFYDVENPIKTRIFVTYHPSFILRDQSQKDTFVEDFLVVTDYLKLI